MSDRPLGRSLIRLGALALGRDRAHRQDLWPGMRIEGAAVAWRGRPLLTLEPVSRIVPRGLPLVAILGSGPSIGAQAVERLPAGSAILLNGAASLAGRVTAPLAVMVEDERFVFRHVAMLAAVARDVPLLLSPAALRALAERDAGLLAGRRVGLIDNMAKPVGHPRRALSDPALDRVLRRGGDAALSRAPDKGVVIVGTVAFSALQVALAVRPAEVLLAGVDLTNAAVPRFYERAGDTAPSGLQKGLARILAGFALARDEAAAQGVALACASPVSALLDLGYPPDGRLD